MKKLPIAMAALLISVPQMAAAQKKNPPVDIDINLTVLSSLSPTIPMVDKHSPAVFHPHPPISGTQVSSPEVEEDKPLSKKLGGKFMGSVGVTTDYTFRGISQTMEAPALQGNVDFMHDSGVKLGLWGSNVDFGPAGDATVEMDMYASYSKSFDQLTAEGGFIYYAYPGAKSEVNYDFYEFYASLGYDFGVAKLAGSVNYSPNFFGDSGNAWYPRLTAQAPLPYDFTVDGWVGYQKIDEEAKYGFPSYTDWALGVGYGIEGFTVKAQYVDTSLKKDECQDNCDAKVILSVSKAFE